MIKSLEHGHLDYGNSLAEPLRHVGLPRSMADPAGRPSHSGIKAPEPAPADSARC